MNRLDVDFNGKTLFNDFDIIVSSFEISPPEPKLTILEIPGTSDVIDLSEAISGDVEYKRRKITIATSVACGSDIAYSRYSKLANYVHGQKMKIINLKDSAFFWTGRVSIDKFERKFYGGLPTISATVDAYKYENQSSLTPWIWDPFSFSDGIIRDYFNLPVPGSLTITGRRKRVCPKFICTTAMTVTYLGNTYPLPIGTITVPDIFLGEGDHLLTFGGIGTINVDYQGASL